MEWQAILVLAIVIPIILIPVVFVWYLNIGGIYTAIKEGKVKAFKPFVRAMRIALLVMIPIAIYASLIWFFLGNFGWPVALAAALVLPIVLLIPVLVWAAVVSGLYQVARDALHRRAITQHRRAARTAEESVIREVAR